MSSSWGSDVGLAERQALVEAFGTLSVCDPDDHDGEGLGGLVQLSLRLRGWLDSIDARIAARAARLAAAGRCEDASRVLAGGGRRARRDAEAAAERGVVCERMPIVGGALATGAVTAGHVDAIVGAARQLDDDGRERLAEHERALVTAAGSMSPEQFDRACRDLARNLSGDDGLSHHERLRRDRNVRRWVDRHTGMCKTLLSLDPLADAKAWTAINAAVATARTTDQHDDDRTWDQLQADAVVDLLTGARAAGDDRAPEVSVLIDYRSLIEGIHDGSTCETSEGRQLPAETVRRLCCEANVIPVVLGDGGEVLDVGRQRRLATRAQRRALRAMYRTCAHPDCAVPFDSCRIHHVIYWEHGGSTDLANMVPLCERHHHLVHEGGWMLQLFPDRRMVWRTPDGTVCVDDVTTDRTPAATETTTTTVRWDRRPHRCQTDRPGRQVGEVARVAAELELALVSVTSRGPP